MQILWIFVVVVVNFGSVFAGKYLYLQCFPICLFKNRRINITVYHDDSLDSPLFNGLLPKSVKTSRKEGNCVPACGTVVVRRDPPLG